MTIDTAAPVLRSSGDLIADRRLGYAEGLIGDGDLDAAAELLIEILERVPDWVMAWFKLGEVEASRGARDAAADAFARALALDPDDELGAGLHLARLGAAVAPASAPPAYIRSLFDQYAGRFEAHLVEKLAYRGPQLLRGAVRGLSDRPFAHAIDLGCGTGLAGAAFRASVQRLTGVDLAPKMVAAAAAKNIYDRLEVASIEAFLVSEPPASADLLVAADLLSYIGDLAPVMQAARQVLRPGGLFAMTLQRGEASIALGADLRFAHAPDYLSDCAAAQGLAIRRLEEAALRRDGNADVAALVAVLEKPC